MLKTAAVLVSSDPDYKAFEEMVGRRVAAATGPLFTTNAEGLFDAYLAGIPEDQRQHYTCHACRRFIERYGGLAIINSDGTTKPAVWGVVEGFFLRACVALGNIVAGAKVTGVFLSSDATWGTPQTGSWTHLAGRNPRTFKHALQTAGQVMAEKAQDYTTLHRGLAEVPLEAVVQAVRVLEADVVDRGEKTLGVAKWLLDLHGSISGLKGRRRENLIWRAVATAPPGWCHVRSTMIDTLLDDVVAGLPFDTIRRRWNEKMHPLQYQRPSAPPSDATIEQANKVVAKLQAEGALARRFARLDEITALWRPRVPRSDGYYEIHPAGGGAFDHLKTKGQAVKPVELPAVRIGWDKFRVTVLPDALEIEVLLPHGNAPFYGLVTAANPDAPPMLQWDGLEGMPRNPVSWYFWHGGSTASQWGLTPGWAKAAAVCLKPCHWQSDKFAHQGGGVFFVIEAARDVLNPGGYFPETLRSEYHGIRRVMEAHARGATFAGKEEGNANGIALTPGGRLTVRVRTRDGAVDYVLSLEG